MSKIFSGCFLTVLIWLLFAPADLSAVTEVTLVHESPSEQETIGNNWLLAIGINNYRYWSRLPTSVSDAKSFSNVLLENYYFKEKRLIELYNDDATRAGILRKLKYLSKNVLPQDSLIIFFSGHGYINPTTKKGSWIPVDGDAVNPRRWISNEEIISMIRPDSIRAKHILVIADTVFADTELVETGAGPVNPQREAIRTAYESVSRQIISSAHRIPVTKKGFETTSVLTSSLIEALKINTHQFLPPSAFYNYLKKKIRDNSGKAPRFACIGSGAAYNYGEFIFIMNRKADENRLSPFLLARKKEVETLKKTALENADKKVWKKEEFLAYPEKGTGYEKDLDIIAAEPIPHSEPAEPGIISESESAVLPVGAAGQPSADTVIEEATPEIPEITETAAVETDILAAPVPAGRDAIDNRLGMTFRYVGPGSFIMGSENGDSDERPHKVTLSRGFYMQTTEVTQAQWKALMGSNPSVFKGCGNNCPVENVSWEDVQVFIKRLNAIENGEKYRLPTEAEWEYACKAGSAGDDFANISFDETAWFNNNSGKEPHPVAEKEMNNLGFFDMQGNVWEWCASAYKPYPAKDVTDPSDITGGYYKVHRGGSWDESVYVCRPSNRLYNEPGFRRNDIGFRLVLNR